MYKGFPSCSDGRAAEAGVTGASNHSQETVVMMTICDLDVIIADNTQFLSKLVIMTTVCFEWLFLTEIYLWSKQQGIWLTFGLLSDGFIIGHWGVLSFGLDIHAWLPSPCHNDMSNRMMLPIILKSVATTEDGFGRCYWLRCRWMLTGHQSIATIFKHNRMRFGSNLIQII